MKLDELNIEPFNRLPTVDYCINDSRSAHSITDFSIDNEDSILDINKSLSAISG